MPLYNPPSIPGLTVSSGTVAINDNSDDQDFRIESDNKAEMLFVDAGNDRVGIGTGTPAATLDVVGNALFRASVEICTGDPAPANSKEKKLII